MKRILLALPALLFSLPAFGQEKASPEAIEFFEKKVRPVLVEHCFECHSAQSKRVRGGLLLDSRLGMIQGGDLGPAIVPGQPEKSRLIEAISHKNLKLKMPQKNKLSDATIAELTAWVKMGAPWPEEKYTKKSRLNDFDLARRKTEHWCWQPVRVPQVPNVKDAAWPANAVDRFLLAALEEKGLKPATDADPATLIRRVHFDVIGLPPTREDVLEFVKAWEAPGANRQALWEQLVDRLLASPQFGERWARHWLDLVRYAESRGHEFDYTIPNAYQYRDYVIRALNQDVPYHQFVREHIAGDLMKQPRVHKDGFNESILGTGFWFLGEEVHSPVDIRQDQADRFDNRIDVMTKTFLGLTVSCARCHDHKFDAISTKDYYALFGILESSNYRLARFDTIAEHRRIAESLWDLREKSRGPLLQAIGRALARPVEKTEDSLLAAVGAKPAPAGVDPAAIKKWRAVLDTAAKDESSPLHAFALAAAHPKRSPKDALEPLLKRWATEVAWDAKTTEVVVDYRNPRSGDFLPDDVSFGPRPVRTGDIFLGSSLDRPISRWVDQPAAERDRAWDGLRLAPNTPNESGSLGSAIRSGRTLRTPEFTLKDGKAYALIKGSGMIYAGVGQHIMLAGPLHGSLVQKFNTGDKFQWVAINLGPYKGQRLHLEFTPNDAPPFALIAVVQGGNPPPPLMNPHRKLFQDAAAHSTIDGLARDYGTLFKGIALALADDDPRLKDHAATTHWLLQNLALFAPPESDEAKHIAKVAEPILDQQKKILAQLRLDSRLAPAMQEGSGTDEHVFIRGNPRTPGDLVQRRFLEALTGIEPIKASAGSGRWELAQQMTDPKVTPHIGRVYVNRVWHHLFGRGIVGSVDNFGVLGEAPTHPELLDYLASRFTAEADATKPGEVNGLAWSTKKLIRTLLTSRAYRMASTPDAKADEADPQNLLLHRMRIRRLEGEAIRDAILRISGRLNSTMYGPSVPVYLTPFQEGRGRPASGPLDGDGRRSVYLSVRRNFLSSFLLAFDTPAPFSTVGRRTMSNVPAQALILMNDPFVHQQADLWAKRALAEKTGDADRVRSMYLDAFARTPSESETRACLAYLAATPEARRWSDLAHVLFNAKEFYFVN